MSFLKSVLSNSFIKHTARIWTRTRKLCLVPPVLLYLFAVVPAEERFLQHQLGQAYTLYCERTPRWLPKWNTSALLRTSPASLVGWYAECQRQLVWLLLPLLAYAVCVTRNMAGWPQFFFFS